MSTRGWKPLEGDTFPSLGYLVADWMSEYLLRPDVSHEEPFVPTLEQLEFLVKLYEINPRTLTRVKHRAVLSRPRGWGKSPFLGAISCAELAGPVRCDGFDAEGQPVGVPVSQFRTPIVSIAATTEDQTANTFDAVRDMLTGSPAEYEYDLEILGDRVTAPRGEIQVITSSGTSVKGKRSTSAILDQTEVWLPSNGGVKLAQTLRNNATKLDGLTIESPNAYTEGENSVAEKSALFARQIAEGKVKDSAAAKSLLYDHRSAPLETEVGDMNSLIEGLRVAYGDSSKDPRGCVLHDPPCAPGWVNIQRTAADFWDTSNDPEVMKADFLNIIGAASDSWVTSPELRLIEAPNRQVTTTEPITLGFDGSEGRKHGIADSTVLIGFSVQKRHLFKIGIWEQPDGPKGVGWRPPMLEIDQTVHQWMTKYNVVGFYADPSAGWATKVKEWEAKYSKQLKARSISREEPIRWNQRNVTGTCDGFRDLLSAIRQENITYDGDPAITRHFLNARKDPRRAGYVLKKADDNQDYGKIDASYGAMFAYKAGLDAIGQGVLRSRERARVPRRLY